MCVTEHDTILASFGGSQKQRANAECCQPTVRMYVRIQIPNSLGSRNCSHSWGLSDQRRYAGQCGWHFL